MKECEFRLYHYMLDGLADEVLRHMEKAMLGENKCLIGRPTKFIMKIMARRMSGEMTTSLGNGFTNLCLFLYFCKYNGLNVFDGNDVIGVVEGDDGLFAVAHDAPTTEQFATLGFEIKMETHNHLNEASFCGMVFDPIEKSNVADPAELLCKFGWTTSQSMMGGLRVQRELLRAKALSLACELGQCPIAHHLAAFALRCTKGYHFKFDNNNKWKLENVLRGVNMSQVEEKLLSKSVPMANRILCQKLFGISVSTQLAIERYLDSLTEIVPLNHPSIHSLMKPQWRVMYEKFGIRHCGRTFEL